MNRRSSLATSFVLAIPLGLVVLQACAGPESETKPAAVKPTAPLPDLSGLAVKIYPEGSDIGREVAMALETELARAGVAVISDERRPNVAALRLFLDLRSLGVAVEGITSLSVESDGVLIDRLTTPLDVFRRDTYPAAVARQLTEAFAGSLRVRALAAGNHGRVDVGPVPGLPDAGPSVAVTPATDPTAPAPEALGKSGRFGLGLSLEADLGWAQIFADSSSLAGATAALALQFDLGPRAAFRLPLSFVFAGSGNDEFGQLALAPTFIYRFRSQTDQEIIPYLGLGLRVGAGVAGRHFLGRPVTGVAGPDSCPDSKEHPRRAGAPIPDCSFFVSPEPVVGLEWHASRIFSLDLAASYSFAHFSSSEGLARWVSLLQVYLGPRVSF